MKKLIAALLTGVMILGLTACSSGGDAGTTAAQGQDSGSTAAAADTTASGSGESIEMVMAWWGNQTRNERTQAALDLYSEQNPGVTFDVQPSEWADYWTKLATASAGHALPDIIQMDYKYLNQYVSNNLLLDLQPYIDNGTLDVSNIDEGIMASGSSGDGVYAICAGINVPALIYNKTLLDSVGITLKDNMTLTEFMDVCREVYEKTGVKADVSYNNGENFIEYCMRSDGYVLFQEDKLGVPDATALEPFFNIYETGITEGWMLDPGVYAEITIGSVEQHPMVYYSSEATQSWCAFFYSNQLSAFEQAAESKGIELGITTWPAEDPVKADYLKPSQFFSVSVDAKNPEEAVKVLDFLTNSVDCNNILLGERGVPASSEVATAISDQLSDTDKKIISFINDVVTPNSSAINPPAPDKTSEVLTVIDQLEEQILYKQITAKEAAEQLFTQGNAILGGQ